MIGDVRTSRTVRRLVASAPRGRGRVGRFISRRYPRAEVFQLVGALANSSMHQDTADPVQAEMAYGAYQSDVIEKMLSLVRPGDVVLTIAGSELCARSASISVRVAQTGKRGGCRVWNRRVVISVPGIRY